MKKYWRLAAVGAVLVVTLAGALVLQSVRTASSAQARPPECTEHRQSDYDCWRDLLQWLVQEESPEEALAVARTANDTVPYFAGMCHQFTHEIGRAAGNRFEDVAESFAHGDDLCASGYYHGVMEAMADLLGRDGLIDATPTACGPIRDQDGAYGLDHYNCVHGLGHGLMAATFAQLFEALEACDLLTDGWEAASCHSGVFMENMLAEDNPHHSTEYLDPEEPLYPCTAVDSVYKNPCYLIQTSYALRVTGQNYSLVFELCETEPEFSIPCWESLGRDVSGNTLNNVDQTLDLCMLGHSYEAQLRCFIGAAKDYVYHQQDDAPGLELCEAIEDSEMTETCTNTVHSFYAGFTGT
jgi:hypothetical protein